MREILISIQPKYVEKILNGEKTIEIRKTKPKCELPCKVYIYCTKNKPYILDNRKYEYLSNKYDLINYHLAKYDKDALNGKVVAEFTLNNIETIEKHQVYNASVVRHNACLNIMQLHDYIKGKRFHAWHIDNLKIYDTPKELSEFKHWIVDCQGWCNKNNKAENVYVLKDIKRPPQSWCYVEKL